jgi:hypothetical protein
VHCPHAEFRFQKESKLLFIVSKNKPIAGFISLELLGAPLVIFPLEPFCHVRYHYSPPPFTDDMAKQQRLCETATRTRPPFLFGGSRGAADGGAGRWSASLRDAAQVCSDVGVVFVDGPVECSAAMAARQIVSERW